jgi:hypothetical protein
VVNKDVLKSSQVKSIKALCVSMDEFSASLCMVLMTLIKRDEKKRDKYVQEYQKAGVMTVPV